MLCGKGTALNLTALLKSKPKIYIMKLSFSLTLFSCITVISLACTKASVSTVQEQPLPTTIYYPPLTGSEWDTISPKKLGWDEAKLNELINFVGDNNSTAFIILWKGRIVTEKYWRGSEASTSYKIFSASKSIAAFLTGLAQEQGKLNINDKVSKYLGAGWTHESVQQEDAITIKHLISMTSGLDDDLNFDAQAGTKWHYNTIAYHKLYQVLAAAYGKNNTDYTREQLWNKIGMQNSFWDVEPGDGPTMSCSARDMARFGLMIMSDAKWNGTPIMNNMSYYQAMLNSSQNLNPSYGYLWWLNGKSFYLLPGTSGAKSDHELMPNAPADLVAALGYGDKKIYIAKSKDLVVIRHGSPSNYPVTYALSNFDNLIWTKLMDAIN